jgi:ribosomal protein L10
MPTTHVRAVYLVDSKNFKPAVLKTYRETLPDNGNNYKIVKVKVLGLVPGSRSYQC